MKRKTLIQSIEGLIFFLTGYFLSAGGIGYDKIYFWIILFLMITLDIINKLNVNRDVND